MFADLGIIAICMAILAAVLYLRRAALKKAPAPYKGALVPEGFYKLCPPIPEGSRPTVLWITAEQTDTGLALADYLKDRQGWEVIFVMPAAAVAMTPALRYHQRGAIQTAMRQATVVVAEGEAVQTAALTAAHAKKPLTILVHDAEQGERLAAVKPGLTTVESYRLVLTANYLVPTYAALDLPTVVAHNPFYAMRFATHTTRRYITILGLTTPTLFYEIARAMPDHDFLAVRSVTGHQVLPPRGLKNVTVWQPQADRRNIYAQTAILVVPEPSALWVPHSLEAAASGIPTVAAAADPVVQEALGDLATYVDSPQVADWVVAIQGLQGPTYEALTRKLVAHAARQDPSKELAAFTQSLTFA